MRLLSREELRIAKWADKTSQRYNAGQNFLAVWPDRVEVTDGCYAMIYADTGKPDAADFPAIPNAPKEEDAQDVKWPILIPGDLAGAILKALPKKSMIPVLKYAALVPEIGGGARIYTTDLESWNATTIRATEERFPTIAAVMPKDAPALMEDCGFNADYLGAIADAGKMIGDGRAPCVVVAPHGNGPAVFTVEVAGRTLTALLMPMKV